MLLGAPVPNLEPRVPPSAAGMQGFGLGDDLGGLTLRPSRVPPTAGGTRDSLCLAAGGLGDCSCLVALALLV